MEGSETVHLHRLTDRVLALDMRQDLTADREVLCHHSQVLVPALKVLYRLCVQAAKGECGYALSEQVSCHNFSWQLLHVTLLLYRADDHGAEDEICRT